MISLEVPVLLLLAEDLQALHERQAGVEHHRELAGEDRDAACAATPRRQARHERDLAALLLMRRDLDLLAAQRRHGGVAGVGEQDSLLELRRCGCLPFHTKLGIG